VTTLAIMKARIETELRRDDLTTQIADAITTAIGELEAERFYFNESRAVTFDTVALQEFYGAADSAFIPRILKFDYAKTVIGGTVRTLDPETPERMEYLSQNGVSTGQPLAYCWYGEQIRLYPKPTEIYTIRFGALIKMSAPASDAEADNPWMVKAEKLVRSYAKYEIYEHVLFDQAKAQVFNPANEAGPTFEAMRVLRKRTNNLTQQGGWLVTPTCF
jgi:hypothetical protein